MSLKNDCLLNLSCLIILDEYSCHGPVVITGEGLQDCETDISSAVVEMQQIHEENLKKLSSMSEKEILEEQTKLKQMLGNKLNLLIIFYSSYLPSF